MTKSNFYMLNICNFEFCKIQIQCPESNKW